jgi:hypothetical protein
MSRSLKGSAKRVARPQPKPLEKYGSWAEAGKRRLYQLKTHGSREKQPVRAMDLAQCQTQQNHASSKYHDSAIDRHFRFLSSLRPMLGPQ